MADKNRKLPKLSPEEFQQMQIEMEANGGIEAGGLGPLDYLGGGMAAKNMYKWGKELFKTTKTVGKDLARHPNKKWIDSFNRWDSKGRGAYATPHGAKKGIKAVALPFSLGAAAAGTAGVNAMRGEEDLYDQPWVDGDTVDTVDTTPKVVNTPAGPVVASAPVNRSLPDAFTGRLQVAAPAPRERFATVDPLNLFGNKNGVNPFASGGGAITNDRFNGGVVPAQRPAPKASGSKFVNSALDLF